MRDMNVLRSGGEQADAEAMRVVSMTSGKWFSGNIFVMLYEPFAGVDSIARE